jgi:hypothetical protein
MTNTIMSIEELVNHVMWSLDLDNLELAKNPFKENDFQDFIEVDADEEVISARYYTFKSISPEGFISRVTRENFPKTGFILVQEKELPKHIYGQTTTNKLYTL